MSYGGISVNFMSNVKLLTGRRAIERAITAIPTYQPQKQFHKMFLCDTTFIFTKYSL
jgi:hypothetical protein